jgi:hypothetical protein
MNRLNKKLIIGFLIIILVVAGHFVPISSKQLTSSPCAGASKDGGGYRVLTGGLSKFRSLVAYDGSDNSRALSESACAFNQPGGQAKLYLW